MFLTDRGNNFPTFLKGFLKMANKESKFTEAVIARMQEEAPLNWEKAKSLGEELGIKPKAIVASANRNNIPYDKIVRTTKGGAKIESKADLVVRIAERVGKTVEELDGLEKATKTALEALVS